LSRLSDLSLLSVERLIVHEIPYRRSGDANGSEPILSDIESALDPPLKSFFEKGLSKTRVLGLE
jgi:hypothetical protein